MNTLSPSTEKTTVILSADELHALRLFSHANGRRWKTALNYLWVSGAYNRALLGNADPSHLQRIRNVFGPTWLVRFRFNNPKTHKRVG